VNHDLMTDFAVEVPAESEDDLASFDAPADEPRSIPADRADAPVSEVTERFLRAVIAKVPLDRIEELHLFAPLRQGGIETGIAVVAARAPVVVITPEATASDGEPSIEPSIESSFDALADAPSDEPPEVESIVDSSIPPVEATAEIAVNVGHDDAADDEHAVADHGVDEHVAATPIAAAHMADDSSPYADSASRADGETAPTGLDSAPGEAVVPAIADLPPAPRVRHTVYTARYRLVLKGPERGRWEADVVDEADAPLLTVEAVVRGVQRRAGEETEILRYSERQIARALRMDWPPMTDVPVA
jgi:hypothetical protein